MLANKIAKNLHKYKWDDLLGAAILKTIFIACLERCFSTKRSCEKILFCESVFREQTNCNHHSDKAFIGYNFIKQEQKLVGVMSGSKKGELIWCSS